MKRAISLAETLLASAIVAVVLGAGIVVLARLTQAEEALGRRIAADQKVARVLAQLRDDLEAARAITLERIEPEVLDLTGSGALTTPPPPVAAQPLFRITLELPEARVAWRSVAVWPEDLEAHRRGLRDNPAYTPPAAPDVTDRIPAPPFPDSGLASRAATPLILMQRRVLAPSADEPPGGWSPAWIGSDFREPTPPAAAPAELRRFPEPWETWETVAGADEGLRLTSFQVSAVDAEGRSRLLPFDDSSPAVFGEQALGGANLNALGRLSFSGPAVAPEPGDLARLVYATPPVWGDVGSGAYRIVAVDTGAVVLDLEGRQVRANPAEAFIVTRIPSFKLALQFSRRTIAGEPAAELYQVETRARRAGDMR